MCLHWQTNTVHWAITLATTVPLFGDHGNPRATLVMALPPLCLLCTTCCATAVPLVVQGSTMVVLQQLHGSRAPSQYPKRRLSVRSRKVSKPRDWYFKLSDRFEMWQAHRQHCCRSACQISERSDNSKYKSRGFETLRDLTKRRLYGYWDGALNFLDLGDHWASYFTIFLVAQKWHGGRSPV